jgi:serine/threonine-protein kinase
VSLSSDPLVGKILDEKYQVEALVGAGAMGSVYRVRHVSLGTIRAVKLMKPELAKDSSFATRFEREARLLEKVRHPHLVALHDFTRLPSGVCYIVSEYVDGETLASLLKKDDPRPREQAASLFAQLADGLAAAHRAGVVHRDVSPDNIMVVDTPGGLSAKVVDFGLAKDVLRGSPGLTGAGLLLGKIGFASPEQMGLLSDDEDVDARSDVFSLAVVLYRALCGRLPWRSESLQSYLHDLIVRPEAELAARIEADAPPAWRDLFHGALARDRERRTPSMSELKDQVQRSAAGRPLRPRAGRRAVPRWRWPLAAAGALAVVAFLATRKPEMEPTPEPAAVAASTPTALAPPPVAPATEPPPPVETRRVPSAAPAASTPEPTVAPAAAAETPVLLEDGRLVLSSQPEARVFVDGEERGRTPLTIPVAPGRHFLRMTSTEGQTFEESIDVASGAVVERDRRFPGIGSLAVVSDPWMEVRIDGGAPEQTPVVIKRITAGRHEIVARRDGFRTITKTVEVRRDEAQRVRLDPDPEPVSTTEQRSVSESPTSRPSP